MGTSCPNPKSIWNTFAKIVQTNCEKNCVKFLQKIVKKLCKNFCTSDHVKRPILCQKTKLNMIWYFFEQNISNHFFSIVSVWKELDNNKCFLLKDQATLTIHSTYLCLLILFLMTKGGPYIQMCSTQDKDFCVIECSVV